jgi:hypothetical protein
MPSRAGGWKYSVLAEELDASVCHVVVKGLSETHDDLYLFNFFVALRFKGKIFKL